MTDLLAPPAGAEFTYRTPTGKTVRGEATGRKGDMLDFVDSEGVERTISLHAALDLDWPDKDEAIYLLEMERVTEQLAINLSKPTTWRPLDKELVRHIAEGTHEKTVPTLWSRSDGQALLYPGRINLFLGESEACKTWAALTVVVEEIRAGNAVLFVDLEDSAETAIERLLQLGLTVGEIVDGFLYMQPTDQFDEVAIAHLDSMLSIGRRVTLAVIDSMTEAMALDGGDPDKGTAVTSFYHSLPAFLTNQGISVVIIDHVTKSHDGRGRWAIGSERKISGLTGIAYSFDCKQEFARGQTGLIEIAVSKDRPGYIRPHAVKTRKKLKVIGMLTLTSHSETGPVTFKLEPVEQARAEQQVTDDAQTILRLAEELLQVIREEPGITTNKLLAEVTGNDDLKRTALKDLVASGKVRVEAGPNRSKRYYAV